MKTAYWSSFAPKGLTLSKKELYILSLLSIFGFCIAGTVTSLKLYGLLIDNVHILYEYERIIWVIMPISFLFSWGIFATLFYLSGMTLGGRGNYRMFYILSALSLNLGTIFFLIQIWQANSMHTGFIDQIRIGDGILGLIRMEGIISNFLMASANLFSIHTSLRLSWFKSMCAISLPIAIIVFLSECIF